MDLKLILRRRNKIIKPRYQLRAALVAVISLFVYSAIIAVIIFYPLAHQLYSSSNMAAQAAAASEILGLHKRFWPAVIVVSALAFIQVILTSHRVAGPVYRFQKVIEEFLRGNFRERVRLRKGDEFKEMEEAVNSLAGYLEGVEAADSKLHAEIKAGLLNALETLKNDGSASSVEARETIAGLIKKLDSTPGAFVK